MAAHLDLANENTLISAAQLGSLEAFNRLVLHYQDDVYNLTYRILGDRDMAADAAQDTFITAFRRLETFEGRYFRGWILRIAVNKCYDVFRTQKRSLLTSLDGLVTDNTFDEFPIADSTPTPEQTMEVNELSSAIQMCINELTVEQRIALVMRDIEGYSYREIAALETVKIGTVKSRLSRARNSLRRSLQQHRELLPAAYQSAVSVH